MTTEKNLPNGITAEMITNAQRTHGEDALRYIDLLDDNGNVELTVLACVPSRQVTGQYRRYIDTDPARADEIIVKACILSHRDEVLADDSMFYGARNGILQLTSVRQSIVKNL